MSSRDDVHPRCAAGLADPDLRQRVVSLARGRSNVVYARRARDAVRRRRAAHALAYGDGGAYIIVLEIVSVAALRAVKESAESRGCDEPVARGDVAL